MYTAVKNTCFESFLEHSKNNFVYSDTCIHPHMYNKNIHSYTQTHGSEQFLNVKAQLCTRKECKTFRPRRLSLKNNNCSESFPEHSKNNYRCMFTPNTPTLLYTPSCVHVHHTNTPTLSHSSGPLFLPEVSFVYQLVGCEPYITIPCPECVHIH